MSVKFTPGPHPTSQSRTVSASHVLSHTLSIAGASDAPSAPSSSLSTPSRVDGPHAHSQLHSQSQPPSQSHSQSHLTPSRVPDVPHSTPTSIFLRSGGDGTGHGTGTGTGNGNGNGTGDVTPSTGSPLSMSFRPRAFREPANDPSRRANSDTDLERQPLLPASAGNAGRRYPNANANPNPNANPNANADADAADAGVDGVGARGWAGGWRAKAYPALVGVGVVLVLGLAGLGGWRLGMGEGGGRWPGGPHFVPQ